MLNQVTAIWTYRRFLLSLVWLDLRMRYKRSLIGLGWSVIHPIAHAASFVLVFSGVLGLSPESYVTTLLLGLAVWGFLRDSAVSGCLALVSHESYIRQSPLPFGLYSLRFVLGYAIQGLFALAVALAAVARADPHGDKLAMIWAIVPALALIFLAGWAVATTFSFVQIYFHDTKHLLEVGANILFYLTPIIYPPSLLVGRGLGWVARLNPVNLYLELVRYPLTAGELPPAKLYLYAGGFTAVLLAVAAVALTRCQKRAIYRL
jgi:ABC-type polysaccharide/polyol phosphate export permease